MRNRHLKRLDRIFVPAPMYFITTCTANRRPILATAAAHDTLQAEWRQALTRHGWAVGCYVIMPDHVHFFCRPSAQAKRLSAFIQRWKEWTAKSMIQNGHISPPIWQEGFFDHLIRSDESYSQKWEYVRGNPVRAGLATRPDDWEFQGYIDFL